MSTEKTFSVAGTTRHPSGSIKVRFANDYIGRIKTLIKNGHSDVALIELGDKFSKAECCEILMQHPDFQSEEQQSAISEFVVRNCRQLTSSKRSASTDPSPSSSRSEFDDEIPFDDGVVA